jgi:monofunctional biosynthetic peptidoglycan transglycosylase
MEPASVKAIHFTIAGPSERPAECDNVGRMVRPSKAKRMTIPYHILGMPRLARPLRAMAVALLVLLLLPYLITPFYAFVDPISTVMLWRRLTGAPVVRTYVPLSHVSPNLVRAVIVAEDGRFCRHYGVDLAEIRDAIKEADDLDDMRGGSTITQQVAKNLFLWPGRSYLRKALEFSLALWIDLVLSKRRILEIYLNIAEWGPNGQFGAEAGSRRGFGKSAADLSHYQAALLAAVLPNPHHRNARRPGPVLRRLAGLYVARARRAHGVTDCLRRTP